MKTKKKFFVFFSTFAFSALSTIASAAPPVGEWLVTRAYFNTKALIQTQPFCFRADGSVVELNDDGYGHWQRGGDAIVLSIEYESGISRQYTFTLFTNKAMSGYGVNYSPGASEELRNSGILGVRVEAKFRGPCS